jgi:hypothetical protein
VGLRAGLHVFPIIVVAPIISVLINFKNCMDWNEYNLTFTKPA